MAHGSRTTLQDVARAALASHDGVSGRELERQARGRGLTISYTTINAMAAGTYRSRPSARTLDALAQLSGYSPEEVHAAAALPMPGPPFADELPPDVDRLEGHQRRAVIAVIRAFLTDVDTGRDEGTPLRSAARTTPQGTPTRGQRRRAELEGDSGSA